MKTLVIAVAMLTAAAIFSLIASWIIELIEVRRMRTRTWSDAEHALLALSIKMVK